MDEGLIQIAVLAFIAGLVLFRLYTTLGRRPERSEPPRPAPAQGEMPRPAAQPQAPAPGGVPMAGGEGVAAIQRVDPSFSQDQFLAGARGAYELILNAFAKGDRDALRGLLTPRVYESYVSAITAREAQGGAGPELVRLRKAELVEGALDGETARVVVKFEAELAEGVHGVRDAREKWTFERDVRSPDPNWRLARVQAA